VTAKAAWHEVNIVGFLERPTPNAALHLSVAALALVVVLVSRRRHPREWSWFTFLYIVPSLALGVVGLARYTTETFPPFIAAGALVAKRPRLLVWAIVLLATGQGVCAYLYIGRGTLI
jgi:hypothetical protein